MDEEKKQCCANCAYFRVSEEYWHDHYLIQSHKYCAYHSRCNEYEVKDDHCCKDFKEYIPDRK